MNATAAVLVKPRHYDLREFPMPKLSTDDGLIRVEACGMCGSDYWQYVGVEDQNGGRPLVPGHEIYGVVEALGRPHGAEVHVAGVGPADAAEQLHAGLAVPEGLGVALEGVHGGGLAQGARPHARARPAGGALVPADADDGHVGVRRRRRGHERRLEEGRDAAERQ